jgi:hypothetical protein
MKTVNTEPQARRMFETFHDKASRRRVSFDFGWPTTFQEIGQAKAQIYRSNKWKKNPREYEDYKHIAESSQTCYAVPGFLRDFETNEPLDVQGELVDLDEQMPEHITILAPLLGIQVKFYDERGKLPQGDRNMYEIMVPNGMLGGANFPETDQPFLVVYTKQGGVHMIIVGEKLDIEKDGIVG